MLKFLKRIWSRAVLQHRASVPAKSHVAVAPEVLNVVSKWDNFIKPLPPEQWEIIEHSRVMTPEECEGAPESYVMREWNEPIPNAKFGEKVIQRYRQRWDAEKRVVYRERLL